MHRGHRGHLGLITVTLLVAVVTCSARAVEAQQTPRDSLTKVTSLVGNPTTLLAQLGLSAYHAPDVYGAEGSFSRLELRLKALGELPFRTVASHRPIHLGTVTVPRN